MATRTWINGSGLALSAANLNSLEADLAGKANSANPAFTGTPTGISKAHVGLGNADNTSDANKPVSTAAQTALNAKANSANPAFTGTPTGITKAHVGLGSVDNTSDANKPISSATQTALNGKVGKGDLVINAVDYGVTGNGTTDDRAALLTALNAGSIILLPNAVIALGTTLAIPANKTIIMNGAQFKMLTASGNFIVSVASYTNIIGTLDVLTADGTNVRGVQISGTTINIDALSAKAPTIGSGVGDVRDGGLAIAAGSSDITIGRVRIENFDYACRIESSIRVGVGNYEVIGYVQGGYISESKLVRIDSGHIRTKSPNGTVAAGHNGILIDALTHGGTSGISLNNILVEDSGEHGYRIGGNMRVSEVWHTNCTARNVGASGFKALGGTVPDANFHDGLHYTDCIAEDCGAGDNNACGFQIQFVKSSTLNSPIVRKRNKTYSAWAGIRFNNCTDVTTNNPIITDTFNACYRVDPELGNNINVRLVGGFLGSTSGNGVVIDYSTITNRRVSVVGNPQIEISGGGYCLSIINTSGGVITGGGDVEFFTTAAAANVIDTVTTGNVYSGYVCNILANFPATPPNFMNASKWTDRNTGAYRVRAYGGWYMIDLVTTTAARPTNCAQGQQALDTTLGKPIWLKTAPSTWIDATGATV